MTFNSILVAFLVTAGWADCHYTFARLRHNDEWKKPYQYIRTKIEPFEEAPLYANFWERYYHWPTYYTDQWDSVRCGRGSLTSAADTEILTVQAGDELEMAVDAGERSESTDANWDGCVDDYGACANNGKPWRIIHKGPVVVHLSAVPGDKDVTEYDGSGSWVKIFTLGLEWREEEKRVHWLPNNGDGSPPHITFSIPPETPAGDYLMRMDQIWPGTSSGCFNPAEFYPSCAHIRVESNSTAELPTGIKIPQNFERYSPGLSWSSDMELGKKVDENWVYPGGKLWKGGEFVTDKPVI